jgi:hypothetical protein
VYSPSEAPDPEELLRPTLRFCEPATAPHRERLLLDRLIPDRRTRMAFVNRAAVSGIALAWLLAVPAGAQALVFSTTTDQPGVPVPVYDEELYVLDSAGTWPELTREALGLLVGDSNGNGIFDDQPLDVDAAHASGLPEPGSYFLSMTADFTLPDGTTIKDGDVFHFTDTGVVVDLPESFFEGITGTTGIDVDGFAIAPNGDLYFSFADDEPTTNASLIAQNGGIATLDEQCVFKFVPGASAATIHLTPAAVVLAFNHAFGTTATTVVDVCDVEIDPASPSDLLLTSLSTAAAFRGKVITTAGGGTPFMIGGQQVGPAAMGLPATTSLDALALAAGPRMPALRAIPEIVSAATPIVASVEAWGFAPGAPVQFVVTDALMPRPAFVAYPAHPGFASSPLDASSALFYACFTIPTLLVPADGAGVARFSYTTAGLPVGVNAVVQTLDLAGGALSTPASVAFTP